MNNYDISNGIFISFDYMLTLFAKLDVEKIITLLSFEKKASHYYSYALFFFQI